MKQETLASEICVFCGKKRTEHGTDGSCASPATEVAATSDNELINTFMGLKSRVVRSGDYPFTVWYKDDPENWFSPPEYERDWNALMQVVEKINKIVRAKDLTDKNGDFIYKEAGSRLQPIHNELCNVNLHNTHFCVIHWIKWYNNQTPKS